MSGNSRRRCRRSRRCAASIPTMRACRRSMSASPRCAMRSDRPRFEAAINAQNFDRAAQLIDQAARAKSLSEPKLAQLREDLRRHRADSDVSRILGSPRCAAAAGSADRSAERQRRLLPLPGAQGRSDAERLATARTRARSSVLTQQAHTAIEQRRLADAEHIAASLRSLGGSALDDCGSAARHRRRARTAGARAIRPITAAGSRRNPASRRATSSARKTTTRIYYLGQLTRRRSAKRRAAAAYQGGPGTDPGASRHRGRCGRARASRVAVAAGGHPGQLPRRRCARSATAARKSCR